MHFFIQVHFRIDKVHLHSGGKIRGHRKSARKSGSKIRGYQVQKTPIMLRYVFSSPPEIEIEIVVGVKLKFSV